MIPKFKPTKWKVRFCAECNSTANNIYCQHWHSNSVFERENVPFFIPEFRIIHMAEWSTLRSNISLGRYYISVSNLSKVALEHGIEPGGYLRNMWWMYTKLNKSYSLKFLVKENKDDRD